jgi:hypothetical protein
MDVGYTYLHRHSYQSLLDQHCFLSWRTHQQPHQRLGQELAQTCPRSLVSWLHLPQNLAGCQLRLSLFHTIPIALRLAMPKPVLRID